MVFDINFREYFFYYFLLGVILITWIFSYFHFMVRHDYVVYYEGGCNPVSESCFVGCEDDSCTSEYYYSKVQKYAPDLLRVCGEYTADCAEANVCLPTDRKCSIIYCDPIVDGDVCATSTPEVGSAEDVDTASSTESSLLPDNTNDNSL